MIKNRIIPDTNWGSHLPVLITAAIHTTGPILELGCGDFSTPVLHALCLPEKRFILSADSDKNWIANFADLENDWHKFMHVPVFADPNNVQLELWDSVNLQNCSVVFIDQAPMRRRPADVQRFKNSAEIIVVHDYEKLNKDVFNDFKYKYVYDRYASQTIIASNFTDVTKFF